MADKKWLEDTGSPMTGARSALEDCASMLQALGYTQQEFGSDYTGIRMEMVKDGLKVILEVIDTNA
jgi:uncharacterized protein (DUF433 family)